MKIKTLNHSLKIENWILKISEWLITIRRGLLDFSKSREVLTPSMREAATSKLPVMDSMSCPYCLSNNFQKRGFRQKKHERVQLYLCLACRKTFTPQITKGKHYPLAVMLDAISIYNLGYSLEETCRIVNRRQSQQYASFGSWSTPAPEQSSVRGRLSMQPKSATAGLSRTDGFSASENPGSAQQKTASSETVSSGKGDINPPEPDKWSYHNMTCQDLSSRQSVPNLVRRAGDLHSILTLVGTQNLSSSAPSSGVYPPTKSSIASKTINIQPSTLANWIEETEPLCRYCQMRPYVIQKYQPKDTVIHATLAHRQLYRYLYHRGKCELLINHEYRHRRFNPLREFLEMVPGECPHQYFQEGLRASETPLTFSKTAMIVRGKQNFATRLAEFVLQSVKNRKHRHQALQKFMLANDSVTVAAEVPVYITGDDIEHMKTQLGFEIFSKENSQAKNSNFQNPNSNEIPINQFSNIENLDIENSLPARNAFSIADAGGKIENCPAEQGPALQDKLKINQLPKLITGHIDILQIRNGMIHILDYKPKAEKERPIEQLTLYAMALSRLTGLRLFEFKCAWFDEKDYFEFYPLHVLHKPKRAQRRRKVGTKEGVYLVNKNERKIEKIRPEAI